MNMTLSEADELKSRELYRSWIAMRHTKPVGDEALQLRSDARLLVYHTSKAEAPHKKQPVYTAPAGASANRKSEVPITGIIRGRVKKLYILENGVCLKIGVTYNMRDRLRSLPKAFKIYKVYNMEESTAQILERKVLQKFTQYIHVGDAFPGYTELRKKKDLLDIERYIDSTLLGLQKGIINTNIM